MSAKSQSVWILLALMCSCVIFTVTAYLARIYVPEQVWHSYEALEQAQWKIQLGTYAAFTFLMLAMLSMALVVVGLGVFAREARNEQKRRRGIVSYAQHQAYLESIQKEVSVPAIEQHKRMVRVAPGGSIAIYNAGLITIGACADTEIVLDDRPWQEDRP